MITRGDVCTPILFVMETEGSRVDEGRKAKKKLVDEG